MSLFINSVLLLPYILCLLFQIGSVIGKNDPQNAPLLRNIYKPLSQYWFNPPEIKSQIPSLLETPYYNQNQKNYPIKKSKTEVTNTTNYKRWGPKFVIIENSKQPEFVRPQLDKNSQILQYNYGNPGDEVPKYSFSYNKRPSIAESSEDTTNQWHTMLPEKGITQSRVLDKHHLNRYKEINNEPLYAKTHAKQEGLETKDRYAERKNTPKLRYSLPQQSEHRRIITPQTSQLQLVSSFLDPRYYKRNQNGLEKSFFVKNPTFRKFDSFRKEKLESEGNPNLENSEEQIEDYNIRYRLKSKLPNLYNAEKKTIPGGEDRYYLQEKDGKFIPEDRKSHHNSPLIKDVGILPSEHAEVYPNADRMDEPQYQSAGSYYSTNENKNDEKNEIHVQPELLIASQRRNHATHRNDVHATHRNDDRFNLIDEPKKEDEAAILKSSKNEKERNSFRIESSLFHNKIEPTNAGEHNAVQNSADLPDLDKKAGDGKGISERKDGTLNYEDKEGQADPTDRYDYAFSRFKPSGGKLSQQNHYVESYGKNVNSKLPISSIENKAVEHHRFIENNNLENKSKSLNVEEIRSNKLSKNNKLENKLPSLESISVESIKQQALEKTSFEHTDLLPKREKPLIRQTTLETGEPTLSVPFSKDSNQELKDKLISFKDKQRHQFLNSSPHELKAFKATANDRFVPESQVQRSTELKYRKFKQNLTKGLCNECSKFKGVDRLFGHRCCEDRSNLVKDAAEKEQQTPKPKPESSVGITQLQEQKKNEQSLLKEDSHMVESQFMDSIKANMLWFYNSLLEQGGFHVLQLYSTGCNRGDCSNAVGSIRMNGVELAGGVDGMNIVVLDYPSFEFLYSKAYNTGFNAIESNKMVRFIEQIQSPCVVLVVSQGEATESLTSEAWKALGKLAGKSAIFVPPGGSLAFIGYKGENILLFKEGNYQVSGDGASAVFSIIGSGNEYMTFGGSGRIFTKFVHEIIVNDTGKIYGGKNVQRAKKLYSDAEEPSIILKAIKQPSKLESAINDEDSDLSIADRLKDRYNSMGARNAATIHKEIKNNDKPIEFLKDKVDTKDEKERVKVNSFNKKDPLKTAVKQMQAESDKEKFSVGEAQPTHALTYGDKMTMRHYPLSRNALKEPKYDGGIEINNYAEPVSLKPAFHRKEMKSENLPSSKYLKVKSEKDQSMENPKKSDEEVLHTIERLPNVSTEDQTALKNIFEKAYENSTDRSFEEGLTLFDDSSHGSQKTLFKYNDAKLRDDYLDHLKYDDKIAEHHELTHQRKYVKNQQHRQKLENGNPINDQTNFIDDNKNVKSTSFHESSHETGKLPLEIMTANRSDENQVIGAAVTNHYKHEPKTFNEEQIGKIHSPEEYDENELQQGKTPINTIVPAFIKNGPEFPDKLLGSEPIKEELNLETPLYFLSPKNENEISEELQDRMKDMVHKEINETLNHFLFEPKTHQDYTKFFKKGNSQANDWQVKSEDVKQESIINNSNESSKENDEVSYGSDSKLHYKLFSQGNNNQHKTTDDEESSLTNSENHFKSFSKVDSNMFENFNNKDLQIKDKQRKEVSLEEQSYKFKKKRKDSPPATELQNVTKFDPSRLIASLPDDSKEDGLVPNKFHFKKLSNNKVDEKMFLDNRETEEMGQKKANNFADNSPNFQPESVASDIKLSFGFSKKREKLIKKQRNPKVQEKESKLVQLVQSEEKGTNSFITDNDFKNNNKNTTKQDELYRIKKNESESSKEQALLKEALSRISSTEADETKKKSDSQKLIDNIKATNTLGINFVEHVNSSLIQQDSNSNNIAEPSEEELIKSLVDTNELLDSQILAKLNKNDSIKELPNADLPSKPTFFDNSNDVDLHESKSTDDKVISKLLDKNECKRYKVTKNKGKSRKKHCIEQKNDLSGQMKGTLHKSTDLTINPGYSTLGENARFTQGAYGSDNENELSLGQHQGIFVKGGQIYEKNDMHAAELVLANDISDALNVVNSLKNHQYIKRRKKNELLSLSNNQSSTEDNSNSRRNMNSKNIDISLKQTEFKWKR